MIFRYKKGVKLSGVIYIHRISDFRMGGSSSRNFKLFRNLCGDDALKNSVVVTNMRGDVDLKKGEKREAELRDKFFKPAIDKGAQLLRHDNTAKTAHDILRYLIHNRPLPLRIQIELVDEKKRLLETVAGEELNRELLELTRRQEVEIRQLQEEMAGKTFFQLFFIFLHLVWTRRRDSAKRRADKTGTRGG